MAEAPVMIAGAGIAGLTLGLALANRGIGSTIVERWLRPDDGGGGIQLGPNATAALNHIGVGDALSKAAVSPRCLTIFSRSQRPLIEVPLAADLERRFGAPYWTLRRADLARVLLEASAAQSLITIVPEFAVATLDASAAAVTVIAVDGRALTASCLIGADGVWSAVRAAIKPAEPPQFTGEWAYRALVDIGALPAGINRDGVSLWMTPDSHVVCYPVDGGRLANVVVVVDNLEAQVWDRHVSAATLSTWLPQLPPAPCSLIVAATDWRGFPLYRAAIAGALPERPLVLIGDAAHPVRPYLAQGAGLAIEDAVELADTIANHGTSASVLAAFALSRQPRVRRLTEASQSNGRIYHLGGAARLARDAALRLLPPASLLRRYDWLYGYRVRWR